MGLVKFAAVLASGAVLAVGAANADFPGRILHGDAPHTHDPDGHIQIQHGGGLDKCGGHWDRKLGTYHYHQRRC